MRRQSLAVDGQAQALLALVPLESELEAESLLAWQQLVQVLTHEIMNSLTPIRSLSQTALALSEEPGAEAQLRSALDAIARRAESLAGFVGTCRRVSQWPAPVLAPVDVRALFARVQARQSRGGRLQIGVRDDGPGVPPGLERQIFLPFFSAREGGQGIGLTVVRQLVNGMGGRVRHVRPLEGGAAFVLSF